MLKGHSWGGDWICPSSFGKHRGKALPEIDIGELAQFLLEPLGDLFGELRKGSPWGGGLQGT